METIGQTFPDVEPLDEPNYLDPGQLPQLEAPQPLASQIEQIMNFDVASLSESSSPNPKKSLGEELWAASLPSSTQTIPIPEKDLSGKPYSELNLHRQRPPRPNPAHLKVLRRIKLPDDMRCPSCHILFDYEGKCANVQCSHYMEIVNEEKHSEFEKEVEEHNQDVMKNWEEELRRLNGE